MCGVEAVATQLTEQQHMEQARSEAASRIIVQRVDIYI